MIACFTTGMCYNLRKIAKDHIIFLKSGYQHYKEPKMWLLPLKTTFNYKTLNLFKVLNIEIS